MAFNISQWRTMPVTVLAGIGLWAISWLLFLVYIYRLTQDSSWVSKLTVALVILSIFLLRGGNWARIIVLMSNAMSVLFLLFLAFTLFVSSNANGAFLVSVDLAAFCLSTYFLLNRGTADFYRKHSAMGAVQTKGKGPRDNGTNGSR